MTLAQFLLILRARIWLMLSIAGFVIAATLAVSLIMQKQYRAAASVVIDSKGVDPISGMPIQAMLMPSFMATQVDILTSDRVAIRVVRLLKLDQVPQFRESWQEATDGRGSFDKWLADMVTKNLDVKPSRESNVLNILYKWPDPKAAAAFANAFAQAYLDVSLELRVEPAKQYATFFAERTKAARAELEAAQARLSEFQKENGIFAADERLDIETSRLNELSSQLVGIQSQRIDSQSRQKQAAAKESMPEVLQNSLIANLKADLARLESRREDVVQRFGRNHPEYQRAESELLSLRDKIERETAKVVGSIGTSNQVNVQRESELRASLESQKKRVMEIKNLRDQLTVLQNDVMSAQRSFDTTNQRFTQTSLESQTQQTNVAILNVATEPVDPASPLIFRNFLISIFLGTLLGVAAALAMELLNKRVRGVQDLQTLAGIPVLGVLQAQPANKRYNWFSRTATAQPKAL